MNNLENNCINIKELIDELEFKTSRSTGKGGQNVNKVSSKVMLIFNFWKSLVLSTQNKELIFNKIQHRINKNGQIQITSSRSRSQFINKNEAIKRFIALLEVSLEPIEYRIDTKPTKTSKIKKKVMKIKQSKQKQLRKKVLEED